MLFVGICIINDFSFICEDHNKWSFEMHVCASIFERRLKAPNVQVSL